MRYNFGIYHWRRRLRTIVVGSVLAVLASALYRRTESRGVRAGAVALIWWGLSEAADSVRRLASPPPWRLDGRKYELLADRLPLSTADSLLDVGCGTGRSVVGLAPALGPDCTVVGVDPFDDRVILGNGARLARRNAAEAGVGAEMVRGDAARLPVASDSVDVVTTARVLHDLPRPDADRALAEARRVCAADGTLGVLELTVTHVDAADPARYWRDRVADAGFTVTSVERVDLGRRRYVLVVAEP